MTTKRWSVGTTMALALLTTAVAAQQPAPQPRPPAPRNADAASAAVLLPATQALYDGYVRAHKMPGIVGAFGLGDLPTVFVAAGDIALDPGAARAGPDSLWRIYSMTKPITGMAAMLLIEDGKLSLDDPLSRYFPAFGKMRVLTSPDTSLDTRPATRPITIRELMTHTSGIGYQINAKGPLLKEYERLGLIPATVNAQVEAQARPTRPASLAAFAERVAQAPLVAEPGTKWHYSMGLDVLAAVVEKASGMSFERFVQTRLLDPLKMTSTFWQVPRRDVGRFATNYAFVGENLSPADPAARSPWLEAPSFPYGGAGLVSSARDYDRFLHMLQNYGTLDGVRVMKDATARFGMSNLLPAGVTFESDGQVRGFGAGGVVYIADDPNGASKGSYGWAGAAGTLALVDPAKRFRSTIMVNYFPAEKWPLAKETFAALRNDAARLHGGRW
ncbi:CubicO group peptidase (beta-lactamase class C family) [Sphingomonas sp. BE138]|uniref:serine hydrolase domain-containing protein n=1 Tax=Sphingomonas sp. BE138 TaxID=2817845 RepID=UPI002864A8F9|nr:serine hydrolase domain-containing protein [Sphingomonas sp. BE138]MDR6787128.1 CubicO group peptidase (beta-lactamase class C family) [Sphingomonas sp. BE138]